MEHAYVFWCYPLSNTKNVVTTTISKGGVLWHGIPKSRKLGKIEFKIHCTCSPNFIHLLLQDRNIWTMTIHQKKRQISSNSQPHQHLTLEPKISRPKHNAQLLVWSLYTRTDSAQLESLLLFCMSEHLTIVQHQDSLDTDSCDTNYCFAPKWTSAFTSSPSLSHPVKSIVASTDQSSSSSSSSSSSLSQPVKSRANQCCYWPALPICLSHSAIRTVLNHHWKPSWSVCHHHHYNDKSY